MHEMKYVDEIDEFIDELNDIDEIWWYLMKYDEMCCFRQDDQLQFCDPYFSRELSVHRTVTVRCYYWTNLINCYHLSCRPHWFSSPMISKLTTLLSARVSTYEMISYLISCIQQWTISDFYNVWLEVIYPLSLQLATHNKDAIFCKQRLLCWLLLCWDFYTPQIAYTWYWRTSGEKQNIFRLTVVSDLRSELNLCITTHDSFSLDSDLNRDPSQGSQFILLKAEFVILFDVINKMDEMWRFLCNVFLQSK